MTKARSVAHRTASNVVIKSADLFPKHDRFPSALDEDGGVLLDRGSLLATHQALRAIAIFAVGRGDHHSVSGVLEIGPVVLGERRHDSLLIERNLPPVLCT